LAGSGVAGASADLAAQLERTSCELRLPPSSVAKHDLPGLFRAALPGTLVLSKVYHCTRCERWHAPVSATAFAITADGACVTNHHVFSRVQEGAFWVVTDAWGTTYPVREVLAASRKDDAAIFRVDVGSGRLTPLPLRGGAGAAPGEDVAVLSHPGGHFYTYWPGHVSRRVWRPHVVVGEEPDVSPLEPHDHGDAGPDHESLAQVLEITADFGVGSSGGPVLDLGGNVVGMVSNTAPVFADSRGRRVLQMSVHMCVPAESILGMIREPGARGR
jgi:hypothetical protein